MANLIVVSYDNEWKAAEVRVDFLKMQKEYLVNIEDAVVVTRKENGKIKLHQMYNLTASGAVSGGFWGMLVGLIFLNPLLGLVAGVGAGAVAGALSDVGINDKFIKDLASTITPKTSALFILVDSAFSDKVLDELEGTGGTIIKSSLSYEDEARLQAAFNKGAVVAGVTEEVQDGGVQGYGVQGEDADHGFATEPSVTANPDDSGEDAKLLRPSLRVG